MIVVCQMIISYSFYYQKFYNKDVIIIYLFMYKFTKTKLKAVGELMIKTADGVEFELHLHNVSFDDKNEVIEIDACSETYWINGNDIIYCWIHKVGVESEK